jgi:hypothetical protein
VFKEDQQAFPLSVDVSHADVLNVGFFLFPPSMFLVVRSSSLKSRAPMLANLVRLAGQSLEVSQITQATTRNAGP